MSRGALGSLVLAGLLVGCGGGDADYDGFSGADDCDDADPTVYPGAPDLPGDGLDADCDGEDPRQPWFGFWGLTAVYAEYFSLDAVDPDGTSGTLQIDEDGGAVLDAEVALREELIGFPLTVPLLLEGSWSSAPGDGRFEIRVEGTVLDEAVWADWSCATVAESTSCAGALKALDLTFDIDTDYTLRQSL